MGNSEVGRAHVMSLYVVIVFFFFNDTATTEIYTLSLHDALPIFWPLLFFVRSNDVRNQERRGIRSEEHTSELQSLRHLVCRLLLEKKHAKHIRFISQWGNRGRDCLHPPPSPR